MSVGKGSLKRAVAPKKDKIPSEVSENGVVDIDVDTLKFKKATDNALMLASVKTFGVLVPIIAVKDGDALKVVDGAKRLTALKELGKTTVKAVVLDEDGKKITAELKKFKAEKSEKTSKVEKSADIHEAKFEVIKAIGDDLPVYLL